MKGLLTLILGIALCMPVPAFATFAPEGTTASGNSGSAPAATTGSSLGAGSDVTVQCQGCEEDRFPMGKGGGRSPDKNDSGAAQMAKNNKKSEEAAEKIAETAEQAQNKEDSELMGSLMDCISGLNTSIFSGDFSGILDKIMQAAMAAACNFAKKQSAKYINQALAATTFELPGGLGTIGSQTVILGHTAVSAGQTGSLKDSGVSYNGQAVLGNPTTGGTSASSQAGYQMFRNGGSILLNSKGLIDSGGNGAAGSIFNSVFK